MDWQQFIGLRNDYAESNPFLANLDGWQILGIKVVITQLVLETPKPFCESFTFWLGAQGYGAAMWNIGVIAGSGPAALPFVAALWIWKWNQWWNESALVCERGGFFRDRDIDNEYINFEFGDQWMNNRMLIEDILSSNSRMVIIEKFETFLNNVKIQTAEFVLDYISKELDLGKKPENISIRTMFEALSKVKWTKS
jgi:hypothetical protein